MNLPTGSGSSWCPCCRPNSRPPGGRVGIIARSLTASFGSCARARRGAMCPSGTAPGPRCTAASAAGAWPACGTGCSPPCKAGPMRQGNWTGQSTLSMGPSSGRTSTPRVLKGGPRCGGTRPQPGRVLDEGPSPRGGPRQAADAAAHAGPATRSDSVRAFVGARRGATPRPGPAAGAARAGGWGQRLHWAAASSLLPPAGDSPHDPAPPHGAPPRAVRPSNLPVAESSGALDQPLQAIPQPRDPLRQARRQLPHPLGARRYDPLASAIGFAYTP